MLKRALLVFLGIFFIAYLAIQLSEKGDVKPPGDLPKVEGVEEKPLSEKELKVLENTRKAEKLEARKVYKELLRNSFLDNGLDIKVDVKGKNKDHLHLQFALFNDVWTRKFETSGSTTEWHEMGFKKVTITDGYDYNMVVTWDN